MTISIATLVLWSIICAGLGASISAVIVAKDEKHYYKTIIEHLQDLYKDAKQEADNWRHWTNVYRRMLDEAEKGPARRFDSVDDLDKYIRSL